jgi:hypothetical protein
MFFFFPSWRIKGPSKVFFFLVLGFELRQALYHLSHSSSPGSKFYGWETSLILSFPNKCEISLVCILRIIRSKNLLYVIIPGSLTIIPSRRGETRVRKSFNVCFPIFWNKGRILSYHIRLHPKLVAFGFCFWRETLTV